MAAFSLLRPRQTSVLQRLLSFDLRPLTRTIGQEQPLRPGSATPVTDSVVRVSRSRLAKCAGGQPTFRVNATLNALAEL